MMFAITLSGAAEAFVLADRLGVAPGVLHDIVSRSSGNSWALQNFCPWPGIVPGSAADEDYAPRFSARLMRKDLDLAAAAAADVGVDLETLASVDDLYRRVAHDDPDRDVSVIVRHVGRSDSGSGAR